MYQLMYHGEIQSCDDAIVQIDHEKEGKQIFETAVRWPSCLWVDAAVRFRPTDSLSAH